MGSSWSWSYSSWIYNYYTIISCLLVKRGGSLSFLTIFTFAVPELLELIWRKIGFLPYVDLNLFEVCATQSRSIKCIMSDLKWLWSNMMYETLWFTIDRYITVYIKVRIQLFWNPIADKETYNIPCKPQINLSLN
jgi:hypothetical protein